MLKGFGTFIHAAGLNKPKVKESEGNDFTPCH